MSSVLSHGSLLLVLRLIHHGVGFGMELGRLCRFELLGPLHHQVWCLFSCTAVDRAIDVSCAWFGRVTIASFLVGLFLSVALQPIGLPDGLHITHADHQVVGAVGFLACRGRVQLGCYGSLLGQAGQSWRHDLGLVRVVDVLALILDLSRLMSAMRR